MKQEHVRQLSVPLSRLVPSKRNPRKVKPAREAHDRLVALIRSQQLLQPLVVRPLDDKRYEVVAGNRRLRALKEIHKGDGDDPKIPCILRDVDAATADALSLGENVGREPMHPLDEAEAFAKLATSDGKDAAAIAAEFGVTEHYVRQRIKLATLAAPVKAAHRDGTINTATAEAFAAVPEDRQVQVWEELRGSPRHADHVRNVIAHAWVDGKHALFDVATLPDNAVSRDLFGDRVARPRPGTIRVHLAAAARQSLAVSRIKAAENEPLPGARLARGRRRPPRGRAGPPVRDGRAGVRRAGQQRQARLLGVLAAHFLFPQPLHAYVTVQSPVSRARRASRPCGLGTPRRPSASDLPVFPRPH